MRLCQLRNLMACCAEWTQSERLDGGANAVAGYEIYGTYANNQFEFAIKSALTIGSGTTFWFNTDNNTATGHQIFGLYGGAEFNINIDANGRARLYTGDAGQTLVGNVDYTIGLDGKTMEFALTKDQIGANVTKVGMLADINNDPTAFLPG